MKHETLRLIRYTMLFLCLILISFIDYFYRNLFSSSYHPALSLVFVVLALTLTLFLFHWYFFRSYKTRYSEIDKYYKDMINEMNVAVQKNVDLSAYGHIDNIENLIYLYKSAQKQQLDMVCQLTNSNNVLEKNTKFANAIVEITSEILRSGDIHSILQLILNKAIEIIPNAQKGSILLYNKDTLEYKAVYGYNMESLKEFRFSFDEIFQAHAKDLYEPIIIPDVEKFNKNLNKAKFNVLKESKGFELKSSISCAISLDNQFYGTINIDNVDSNHAFIDEHKPTIKYFAEQISVALKNAQLIEKILYLSHYDSMTNICNRAYFEEQLDQLHRECEENKQSFTIVIFDMNDLKIINDNYGHDAGDKLIITLTNYILNIEQKPNIFGRIGGDEFALVYSNKSSQEVIEIMEKIRNHFASIPFRYNNMDLLNISFGYGVCTYPKEAQDIFTLYKKADQLMYLDKRNSKHIN